MSRRPAVRSKRSYRMVVRAESAAATSARILAAAWRLFSERPFDDVLLADVARDAEVSVPTIHTKFGSKDGLFVAMWVWRAGQAVAGRDDAAPGDVPGALRQLYDSYEADGDAFLRVMAQEDRIPAIHQMADAGRAYHRAWVERTFAEQLGGLTGVARQRRLAALVVSSDLLTWKLLRREMGLDRATAERTAVEMVTALGAAG